jgi:hypothetical protein
MNRYLSLILLVFSLLMPCARAQDVTPHDYVISKGYTIAEQFESPGWRTCYMLENSESQSLCFSDDANSYCVIELPMLDVNFDPSALRSLFFDLVATYEWDVSYHWPDYGAADKIAVSYGIEKDLDKTLANYASKDEYLPALSSSLGLSPSVASFASLGVKENAVTKWFASESLIPDRTFPVEPVDNVPCATYLIAPHTVISQTGSSDYVACSLSEDLTDAQVMSMYGRLLDYVRQNASKICAAGLLEGSSGYDVLMVAQLANGSEYVGVYNILTEEFSIEYEQAA